MDSYGFLGIPTVYYHELGIPDYHVAEKQVMPLSIVIDNDTDIDPCVADQFIKKMIIWHFSRILMMLMDSWRFLWIAVTSYGILENLRYSYGIVLIAGGFL